MNQGLVFFQQESKLCEFCLELLVLFYILYISQPHFKTFVNVLFYSEGLHPYTQPQIYLQLPSILDDML
jgi:hypothetical protein